MALETVDKYVSLARVLLQDEIVEYRYSDAQLVTALSLALQEAKKLRFDLFLGQTSLQSFTIADIAATTAVNMDEMYRVPLVYYMCGHVQLRDDEESQDERSVAFFSLFNSKLLTVS